MSNILTDPLWERDGSSDVLDMGGGLEIQVTYPYPQLPNTAVARFLVYGRAEYPAFEFMFIDKVGARKEAIKIFREQFEKEIQRAQDRIALLDKAIDLEDRNRKE